MIRDLLTELFDIAIPPAPFSCRMFIGPDVTAFGVDQEQERDRQLEVTELTTVETCQIDLICAKKNFDEAAFRRFKTEVEGIIRIAMIGR